jgi:uncharacterized SAM-binding protein YcdF (DUF218 family)
MFYFLSKTLYVVMSPLAWALVLLLYAWWRLKGHALRKYLLAAFLVLWLGGNRLLSDWLIKAWEIPPTPLSAIEGTYDVAIVLGGVTDGFREPNDRVYTHKGADRVLHAALLYEKNLVLHLLLTGSHYKQLIGEKRSEAASMRDLLRLCHVPDSAMTLEEESVNTRENALFCAEILKANFPEARCLLITSAFHLRRAQGCFEKAGIATDAFSTDFYSSSGFSPGVDVIFPSEEILYYNARILREILGYFTYKLIGYA